MATQTLPEPCSLRCPCCGGYTTGRQWFNQDTGYGLCERGADRIITRKPFGHDPISPAAMEATYGVRGMHYAVAS